MVIPMPVPAAAQTGPPSQEQLAKKPLLVFTLFAMSGCMVVKFGPPELDIMGGFMILFQILLGGYCVHKEMDVTIAVYFGMFAGMQGVMEMIRMIDRYVKYPETVFPPNATAVQTIHGIVLVATPLVDYLGAYIAYSIYSIVSSGSSADAGRAYARYDASGRTPNERSSLVGKDSFKVFSGEAHRLGD